MSRGSWRIYIGGLRERGGLVVGTRFGGGGGMGETLDGGDEFRRWG